MKYIFMIRGQTCHDDILLALDGPGMSVMLADDDDNKMIRLMISFRLDRRQIFSHGILNLV